ncbi:MAG: hypothetical protein M3068_03260 [Gemmatimonadota bacterium]|nr:hypothetical protein [Gemmatimonadota bacterium]
MRRVALPLLAVMISGCAYFNGIYNARQAEKRGDKAARTGHGSEAQGYYGTAALKAETVLVRYGKGRWRDDALYLAGRGWALSGDCARGVPRLQTYVALSGQPREHRDRAALALGGCLTQQGHFSAARQLLVPLLGVRDTRVASEAALWAARSAIALGETDTALAYLRRADASAAEWELAAAYLSQQRYVPAESLLARRARSGDDGGNPAELFGELWRAGRSASVERLMSMYDASRLSALNRARLHVLVGDLWVGAHADSLARGHYALAQRLARDSAIGRDAGARLTLASLGALESLVDVENAIRANRERNSLTPAQQHLEDELLLVKMLEDRTDFTGAALFLAGEVARDSLRAYALAHTLFKRVVSSYPRSLIAPKALLAAGAVRPESAETYQRRLIAEFPTSPYAALLTRGDSASLERYSQADNLLLQMWTVTTPCYADSLRKLHPPPANPQLALAAGGTGASRGQTSGSGSAGSAGTLATPSLPPGIPGSAPPTQRGTFITPGTGQAAGAQTTGSELALPPALSRCTFNSTQSAPARPQ